MKIIVNAHKCEIDKTPVNEKEINITKCEFEFADEITDSFVKEAYFTLGKGETYKQIIVNNECDIPGEVLKKKGDVTIGVVAYLVENNTTIKRYNPSPAYFNTWEGSLRDAENSQPITPSEMEQYEQALQDGLSEVNQKLVDIDEAIEDVNEAITETNNLNLDVSKSGKVATVTLTKKDASTKTVTLSDGTSLMFNWDGTKLGIKTDEDADYTYVDLQGIQGVPGPKGEAFQIKKTYTSVAEMNADFNNMQLGDYVMIATTVEVEDNAKLYTRGEEQWIFISDFSGATGIRGETGLTPNIQIGTVTSGETPNVTRTGTNENPILNFTLVKGDKGDVGSTGPTGATGNGIASITKTSTEGLVDTYTITYTDGTTSTFQITNGEDGETPLSDFNALKADVEDLRDNQIILSEQGTNIHVKDAAKARLYEFEMDKESTQDGEPTPDNPVEVKTVKGIVNLYDKTTNNIMNTSNTRLKTNGYIALPAGTYTISYTGNVNQLYILYYDSNHTKIGESNWASGNVTFTYNQDYEYKFTFRKSGDATVTPSDIDNIQIVEGTEEKPYVPYGNNYVDVKVTGKNLFNKDITPLLTSNATATSLTTGVRVTTNSSTNNNSNIRYVVFDVKKLVGETFTLSAHVKSSANNPGFMYLRIVASDGSSINTYPAQGTSTTTNGNLRVSYTIPTLDETYHYLLVALYSSRDYLPNVGDYVDYTDIQLEQSSTTTTYEPYKETIVPIPLNGNEIVGIGNYLDEYIVDKEGHVWLNKLTGKVIYNGSENWAVNEYYNNTFQISRPSGLASGNNNFISNYYSLISNLNEGSYGIRVGGNLNLKNKDLTTLEDLKTWLSNHNTNIYYQTTSPQLIDLNTTVDLRLFKGVNNITNSEDGNMRIRYVESIESIINDFDTRLKTLEQGQSL